MRFKLFQHFSGTNSEVGKCPDVSNYSAPPPITGLMISQESQDNSTTINMTPGSQMTHSSQKNEDKFMIAGGMIKKQKKSRVLFSQWQINELEKLFKKQKYVTSNERELMAKRLKLQANQVQIS